MTRIYDAPPRGDDPAACWAHEQRPAVIETETTQLLVQPAETDASGREIRPARYASESRQKLVRPRRDMWFRTPCPEEMTPALIASLQRALAARGLFGGPVTGELNAATARAVRAYQAPQGLDAGTLSLAAGRQLGLFALDAQPGGQQPVGEG